MSLRSFRLFVILLFFLLSCWNTAGTKFYEKFYQSNQGYLNQLHMLIPLLNKYPDSYGFHFVNVRKRLYEEVVDSSNNYISDFKFNYNTTKLIHRFLSDNYIHDFYMHKRKSLIQFYSNNGAEMLILYDTISMRLIDDKYIEIDTNVYVRYTR